MAAYEVDTEDLIGIRDQLAAQADRLTSTTAGVGQAGGTMLLEVAGRLTEARTTIDGVLADLAATVDAATAAAEAADWLGPDAQVFRYANADLATVITRSRAELEAALTEHGAARDQLGESLRDTLGVFTAATTRSAELTEQLEAVVAAEAASYEAAFAGGFGMTGGPGGAGPLAGGAATETAETATGSAKDGTEVLDEWEGPGGKTVWERPAPPIWGWDRTWGQEKNAVDLPVEVKPLYEDTLWEDDVDAQLWRSGGTFGNEDGLHGAGRATVLGADAEAKATWGVTHTGAFLGGTAAASAVLASVEGQLVNGPVTANGRAFIGGEAGAEAKVRIGPTGVQGTIGGEAFLGGKAEGEVSAEHGGVTAGVGGELSYGIGAHAEVDGSFTTDRVGVSVDVGATLGLGAGVKFDVSVDPGEVLDNLNPFD